MQTLLYCFHYDPATGRYSLIVTRAVNVAATLTAATTLAGGIGLLLWRERRAKRRDGSNVDPNAEPRQEAAT